VVSVYGASGSPAFVYTSNGGQTWAVASVPSLGVQEQYEVRCDKNGYCIDIASGGTDTSVTVTVLRSADYGRTWTASRAYSEPSTQTLQPSCGDGRQCMLVSNSGYLIQATATADGRVTVRRQSMPGVGSRGVGVDVSCATARDCFVATNAVISGYAVIEATHNGGRSWQSLALPKVGGAPLALVALLGCPIRVGCLGLAATASQSTGQDRVLISDLP
jgi:hypothetical protein